MFGKERYLNTIAEVIELHATLKVGDCSPSLLANSLRSAALPQDPDGAIPPYMVNHGVLPPAELMRYSPL